MPDTTAQPKDYGPVSIVANGMDGTEHFTVPAGRRVPDDLAVVLITVFVVPTLVLHHRRG